MIVVEFITPNQSPASVAMAEGMVLYPTEVECSNPEHTHENKGELVFCSPLSGNIVAAAGFGSYERAIDAYNTILKALTTDCDNRLIQLHNKQGDFLHGTTDHIPKV